MCEWSSFVQVVKGLKVEPGIQTDHLLMSTLNDRFHETLLELSETLNRITAKYDFLKHNGISVFTAYATDEILNENNYWLL